MPPRVGIRAIPIATLVSVLALSAPVHADGAKAPVTAQDRAMDLFEQSEVAYQQGRFADAIDLLRRSYALHREPVLLYNMGRAYEGLGDIDGAAAAYKQFLAEQPDTPDRGAIEQRVATLTRQQHERDEARRPKPPPARSASAIPWIVAGIGAAAVGAGAVAGLFAHARNDDAAQAASYRDAASLHDEATSLAVTANVCFIAGGAIALAGVIWGVIDVARSGKTAAIPAAISF